MIKRLLFSFVLIFLAGGFAFGQSPSAVVPAKEMINYVIFSTGVDAGRWYTLDDYTAGGIHGDNWSGSIDLPFTFHFNGAAYTQWAYNTVGEIMLGIFDADNPSNYDRYNEIENHAVNDSSLGIKVMSGNMELVSDDDVRYQTFGTAPNRVFVVQYKGRSWNLYSIGMAQVQLSEQGSVTLVYGECSAAEMAREIAIGIGHTYNNPDDAPLNRFYNVDQNTHTCTYGVEISDVTWPGQGC